MSEHPHATAAKVARQAEIVADANDLKADSSHSVSDVRRAERDALAELADGYEDAADTDAIASIPLPSERIDEYAGEEEVDDSAE